MPCRRDATSWRKKRGARGSGTPAIYVNDNLGRWEFNLFLPRSEHCLEDGVTGRLIVQLLAPDDDNFSYLRPNTGVLHGDRSTSCSNTCRPRP